MNTTANRPDYMLPADKLEAQKLPVDLRSIFLPESSSEKLFLSVIKAIGDVLYYIFFPQGNGVRCHKSLILL